MADPTPADIPSLVERLITFTGHADGCLYSGDEDDCTCGLNDIECDLRDALSPKEDAVGGFQARVQPWLIECFGPEIAADKVERNDRFVEESLELVQSLGYTADRAHALVDYVFGRPIGEPSQESGGVMVTHAALCLANGLDMAANGETELARISAPEIVAKIRAKQAAKPTGSALPIAYTPVRSASDDASAIWAALAEHQSPDGTYLQIGRAAFLAALPTTDGAGVAGCICPQGCPMADDGHWINCPAHSYYDGYLQMIATPPTTDGAAIRGAGNVR